MVFLVIHSWFSAIDGDKKDDDKGDKKKGGKKRLISLE